MASDQILSREASHTRDDLVVTGLVIRARSGEQQSWDALVDRYAPLIWSICRRYRLEAAEAQDAAQNVWLKLVDQLDMIRDPAALPGWLAAVTRRECGRSLRAARNPRDAQAEEQDLLAAERHAALREAFEQLPAGSQQLLALLVRHPALPDDEIGARLGIPVGRLGPARRRGLDELRRHPAITALIDAST